MKKIKFFALLIAGLAMLPSCHNNQEKLDAADSINSMLNDSLVNANAEKDSLLALMNDIAAGMQQIKDMEEIVSVQNISNETPDRKQQLRNDMVLIQQSIEKRKQRLDELEKRLSQSTNYNEETKKTIETLKTQLASQETLINDLKQQLAKANVEISNLNTRVDSLNTVNATVTNEKNQANEDKKKAQEEATKLANDLNACYYAIGSKSELKSHNIIETGFLKKTKILEGDFEKSYFTKADKRTLNEIQLHSKKASVMSKHPSESYQIVDGTSGKILRIINSTKFWEVSNYLVVKID